MRGVKREEKEGVEGYGGGREGEKVKIGRGREEKKEGKGDGEKKG